MAEREIADVLDMEQQIEAMQTKSREKADIIESLRSAGSSIQNEFTQLQVIARDRIKRNTMLRNEIARMESICEVQKKLMTVFSALIEQSTEMAMLLNLLYEDQYDIPLQKEEIIRIVNDEGAGALELESFVVEREYVDIFPVHESSDHAIVTMTT